jgi:hypothetical protein
MMAGDITIIASGIADGEQVVTEGQYKLQANSPVKVTPPTATASSAGAPT